MKEKETNLTLKTTGKVYNKRNTANILSLNSINYMFLKKIVFMFVIFKMNMNYFFNL